MSDNIFERGMKLGLRFQYNGVITTEDLWRLDEHSLKIIRADLREQVSLEEDGEDAPANPRLQLRLEIVNEIIAVKKAEALERTEAANKKLRKEKLLALYQEKQDEVLLGLPLDDLKKLIDEL